MITPGLAALWLVMGVALFVLAILWVSTLITKAGTLDEETANKQAMVIITVAIVWICKEFYMLALL